MFKWLQQLFQKLGAGRPAPVTPPAQTPVPPVAPKAEEKPKQSPGAELRVELKRYSTGSQDILGKLTIGGQPVGYTLESALKPLAPGEYPLSLRSEGGKHTTYAFRFGPLHKGMIQISKNGNEFVYLLIGNEAAYLYGSIAVGTQPVREEDTSKARELWYSEQGYKSVYQQIAGALVEGKKVVLVVS
ncbi:MAG: hypothetical protein EAZ89_11275 [Bacteroidetes bacterium]|nr:MAG: hypothetical protein EAZ89_11275 [Bacteroidota bacterium]